MREAANRSIGLALLASILLHALLLAVLPSLRELAAQLPRVPAPLVAHLAQPAASPAASPPAEEVRKTPAPEKRPASPPPAAKAPPPPTAKAPPPQAAVPPPAPAPQVAPPAPSMQAPATSEGAPRAPAPTAASAPASVAPLARLDPLPAPAAPPGPDPGALDRYRLQLVTVAARFKRYPRSAIDNNWEGVVVVGMTIGADGRIAALGIRKSSGHEVLDRQALEMFRIAKPFVQLPRELDGREFELELRAIYSLKDQPSG